MRTSDFEFFRYFPVSSYPISVHPDAYMYAWETGRVLHEYQALYIARGDGGFESKRGGTRTVPAGSVMLLYPGEWHRYRPRKESGWDEYWVSFGGQSVDHLVRQGFFSPEDPVFHTGVDEAIQHAYLDLLDRARVEPIGFQQLNAASVQEILAATLAAVRRQRHGGHGEAIVRRAKAALEEQVEGMVSITKLAGVLGLCEEHLRRLFREHTGMSPYQYYLELKIHRARLMLRETTFTVKHIARSLGFESPFHFSKAFKQRTGVSPTRWRCGE
jgi:AraC-like DNA-binding protein